MHELGARHNSLVSDSPSALPRDNRRLVSYTSAYTPSTRQWLVYKNDIPLLRRRDIPLFRGLDYPCSVGLIDLLCIRACQHIHAVKAVGSKFVSFITF